MVEQAAPGPARANLVDRWPRPLRYVLRSPIAEIFEFEAEEGRLRLGGLSPFARWLVVFALSAIGLLLAAALVPGILAVGPLRSIPVPQGALNVHNGTAAVTLVLFGIAWGLVSYGALQASWLVRAGTGLLFLLVNSLLIVNLPSSLAHHPSVTIAWDLSRAALVATSAGLVLSAFMPGRLWRRTSWAKSLLNWVVGLSCVGLFVSLIAAEALGRVTQARTPLAGGAALALGTVILLLAPLLYLSGMAVVSFSYTVGTAGAALCRRLPRHGLLTLVVGLVGAEAWFYGWRDRTQLWTGPRGWVVLLHAVPVVVGFGAIAFACRKVFQSPPEPVHDNANATLALLVTLPAMAAGLYSALYDTSGLGFLHIPGIVTSRLGSSASSFSDAVLSTGARCTLFGAATAFAMAIARREGTSWRRRQFAVGVALMSGWIFWTQFVDWLPSANTEDWDMLALVAVGVVAVYLLGSYALPNRPAPGTAQLAPLAGVLAVVWIFDADAGFLRSLSHLAPLEGSAVLVAGVLLILLGKSQFTGGTSPWLPRSARVAMWTGYVVLSLTVVYWDRSVKGFAALTGHNAELSVFDYIAVPLITWLVLSGRFTTRLPAADPAPAGVTIEAQLEAMVESQTGEAALPAGPARAAEPVGAVGAAEPVGAARTVGAVGQLGRAWRLGRVRHAWRAQHVWQPAGTAILVAGVLCAGAWGAYAIDTAGAVALRPIAHHVYITVPKGWSLQHKGALALETRSNPAALFVVLIGPSLTGGPSSDLSLFAASQSILRHVVTRDPTSFSLTAGGNFSEIALARFRGTYSGQPAQGQMFSLFNQANKLMAVGLVFTSNRRDYLSVAAQVAQIENSLNQSPPPSLW